MTQFYKKVDLRSRTEMVAYLDNHFRYDTASHWNRDTSYANNIKIHSLKLGLDVKEYLWQLLDFENYWDEIRYPLDDFASKYDYKWQVGVNGRSGGYLVLYRGGKEPSGYKSYCTICNQQNYKSIEETSNNICGKCHMNARVNYTKTHYNIVIYTGRGLDRYEDFEGWSMDKLRERVMLIQDFDLACDAVIAAAIYTGSNFTIKEETYSVIKTRKILVENEAA